MAISTSIGNKVLHAVLSKEAYTNLATKSADTLYFVGDSTGIQLYKGEVPVGGGFKTLSSIPSNTTGMAEGVLYLAPNGKMYYNAAGTLTVAMDLVKNADLPANGATGNDGKIASIAAMYTAINNEITSAMAGTYRNSILAPVADVTALKAVTGMNDKDIIFVEGLNAIFAYDAQSNATDNTTTSSEANTSPNVVQPTSVTGDNAGRWIRISTISYSFNSTDFTWDEDSGLSLNSTRVSGILSTAEGYVTAHNSAADAHSSLFAAKLDKPTTAATDGQHLVWDGTTSKPKWADMPNNVKVVASAPTVTAANNGEVYYVTSTDKIYEVESGTLVQKGYSKADIDTELAKKVNKVADVNATAFTSALTSANVGEVYYDLATNELYVIEAGEGSTYVPVRKSYSKANADLTFATISDISWNNISYTA